MTKEIKLGFVDYTALVFIPDSASTDGSGKTGLVAANLTVSYTRVETDNDVTVTDVTSSLNNLAALTTVHTDWGLLEVSSTLAPGLYRLDIADAVFASGAWTAVVYVMITLSAAAASPMEFILIAFDPLDTVRLGLTALPNAAAQAAGGLYTRGTGAGQINQPANGLIDVNVENWNTTAVPAEHTAGYPIVTIKDGTGAGELDTASGVVLAKDHAGANLATAAALATVQADTDDIQTRLPAALTGAGNIKADVLAISGDATAADNEEAFFDGTGYAGTGNVIPTVTNVTNRVTANVDQLGGVSQSLTDLKDFADDGYDPATNKVQGVVLTDTVTTYTGNTPQTGDGFARLGAPAGASVSADILTIDNFVDDLEGRLTAARAGYLDNLSAGAVALQSTASAIETDTQDIQSRLPAALVSGRMDANMQAAANGVITAAVVATDAIDADALADGAITAAVFAAGAIDNAAIAADAIGSSELAASAVTEIQSGLATAASISALNNLSAAQVNAEVVDAISVDVIADSVATDGSRPTLTQAALMILRFLTEKSASGTTVTVKKEDGTTASFTLTLDSATTPTSITRAS